MNLYKQCRKWVILTIISGEFTLDELNEFLSRFVGAYNWQIKKYHCEFKALFPSFNLTLDAVIRKVITFSKKSVRMRSWSLEKRAKKRNMQDRTWIWFHIF